MTTNHSCDLSEQELQNLTCDQLINAYKLWFNCKVMSQSASKLVLIITYKRALVTEVSIAPAAPAPPKPMHPRVHPLITTEFTVTRDPSMCALQGPQPDTAVVVCSLQTVICQAYQGSNPSVTLLSSCWSSQLLSNFVLTFAGQLSNNEIFHLCTTLLHPFQPGVGNSLLYG